MKRVVSIYTESKYWDFYGNKEYINMDNLSQDEIAVIELLNPEIQEVLSILPEYKKYNSFTIYLKLDEQLLGEIHVYLLDYLIGKFFLHAESECMLLVNQIDRVAGRLTGIWLQIPKIERKL